MAVITVVLQKAVKMSKIFTKRLEAVTKGFKFCQF